jgi:hypothetical protein
MSIVLEGNTVLGTPDSAEDDFPGVAREESHARKWEDSSPDIAKIKHIGIAAPYRNLFNILSARIRLHLSTGWRLFRKPYNIFATIDLKK